MAAGAGRWRIVAAAVLFAPCSIFFVVPRLSAQEPPVPQAQPVPDAPQKTTAQAGEIDAAAPLAVVAVDGVELSGALQVSGGKATLGSSGSITAGERAATVTLPSRGQIRLCATTHVSLSADKSIAASMGPNEAPGLMMALDHGAMETSFTTGKNSDVILTPDFRITISGPGTSMVQVRLGEKGDTCVDNRGPNAPYVTVSSVFDGGVYRVQDGQRVLFEHGSLHEVVDREKELCGCPEEPAPAVTTHAVANPFPAAQSAGLAPMKAAPQTEEKPGVEQAQASATLHYNADDPKEANATVTAPETQAPAAQPKKKDEQSKGFLGKLGHFFRTLFGG